MEQKINQLINDKKFKEALKIIEENQKSLFLKDPITTMNNHIYVLIELSKYEQCFDALDLYKTYPYQNIKVEEHLHYLAVNLPKLIKNAMNQKNKELGYDENGVDFSKFSSKNSADLHSFIYQIYRTRKYKEYQNEIELVLKRNVSDQVNFMCLCLLYEINSEQLVDFQYKNSSYSVKLNEIHFPYSNDDVEYFEVINELSDTIKDVSILNTAKDLAGYLRVEIFPNHFEKDDVPYIVEALRSKAKSLYQQPNILLENERVKFFLNLLNKISNS